MWNKTKSMMIGLIERAKSLAAELREKSRVAAEKIREIREANPLGKAKFANMREEMFAKMANRRR